MILSLVSVLDNGETKLVALRLLEKTQSAQKGRGKASVAVELSHVVHELRGSLHTEVGPSPGSVVTRLALLHAVLEGPLPDAGERTLVLADQDWLRNSEPNDLRTSLSAAKERGVVGVVVPGDLDISDASLNVFRQLKLFLGSGPEVRPESPDQLSQFQLHLQSVLDRGFQHDQNRLAIVQQLLRALNSENPIASLIAQLGRHCEGSAVLYDSAGMVFESTGSAPANLVHNELSHRDLSKGVFTVGRWNVVGRDVSIRTQSYVLVLATRSANLLDEYGTFMLDSVASLLGTFQSLDSFAMVQQVQHSAHLFRELELGISLGKEMQFWDRMRDYGFTAFAPLRFVSASTADGRLLTKSELESIAEFAARSATPVLVSEHVRTSELPPGFHMLAEASAGLTEWLSRLSGTMSVGVSAPYSQLSRTPELERSAQLAENLALKRLKASQDERSTVVYVDELSPAEWLLGRAHSDRDQAQLEEYVAQLRENPELLKTLLVYFSERMKIVDAAHSLGIHQNTLRYRLTKIEGVLKVPLSEPATIANLYLALYDELTGSAKL